MSLFSLTKGSAAALGMLTRHAGTETLLLTQPARELRAEITIEPIGTVAQRGQIEAVLFMREQRHTMTLQRDDRANAQHLADWVEAAANGTLDTAEAIPQRRSLLPCCKCGSEAISYDYAIPGSEFRNGVKCRHQGCQFVEGAETAAEADAAWNAIQREGMDESNDTASYMPVPNCACPSGSGSLHWPCPEHQPAHEETQTELADTKDTERLAFMLQDSRKVVIERLPGARLAIYVEGGFMGDERYPRVFHSGDWPPSSSLEMTLKRNAIDAALASTRPTV